MPENSLLTRRCLEAPTYGQSGPTNTREPKTGRITGIYPPGEHKTGRITGIYLPGEARSRGITGIYPPGEARSRE